MTNETNATDTKTETTEKEMIMNTDNVVELNDVREKNQYNENGKKEGYWEEEGQRSFDTTKGNYTDGKKNGVFIITDEFGYEEGIFRNGQEHGTWKRWGTGRCGFEPRSTDGTKSSERTYKNGKLDGTWTHWYANGNKQSEDTYVNGERDGTSTKWNRDGTKESEETWVDGKRDGTSYSWNPDGTIYKEQEWKDGELDGTNTSWIKDGTKTIGTYRNGKRDGTWVSFYDDGTKRSEGTFKDGKPVGVLNVLFKEDKENQFYDDSQLQTSFLDKIFPEKNFDIF